MVSTLDSGWGTALCSWARHFTLVVFLYTLALVVQGVDNTIHRVNQSVNTYPLFSDLTSTSG